ncbi:MAG: hypothetical protein Q8N81_07705, partial [bacterium]|nr:hypothetical protein [bacterium]
FCDMKLHGLTPVVSWDTFGSQDTRRAAIRPHLAAYELRKTLRFAPGLASSTALRPWFSPKVL